MGRPYHDARAAIRRVEKESPAPFEQLCELAGVGAGTLLRWALQGKRVAGRAVYLDAIYSRRDGWRSSVAAVLRFLREVTEDEGSAA